MIFAVYDSLALQLTRGNDAVHNEYVAVPFSANTTKADGTKRKQDWWIGLVNDGGQWKVFYAKR
jgi:hypothetical protein